jgi:hypothetical protein
MEAVSNGLKKEMEQAIGLPEGHSKIPSPFRPNEGCGPQTT